MSMKVSFRNGEKNHLRPTTDQYDSYQNIFDFFNKNLFNNELPNVLLTFSRKTKTHGFFAPQRWQGSGDNKISHEISLNPQTLWREPIEVLSTLVHEQVHLWQQEKGNPSRGGYHNLEWAEKMEAIGLMPSDTGEPGGKRTGQRMTHYIIEGGPFQIMFNKIPRETFLPLKSLERESEQKPKRNDKVKYSCPGCETNVWGKSGIEIECINCGETFEEQ